MKTSGGISIASAMTLRSGFILIAQRLQEAADMAHSTVRNMLSDAVHDAHRGTGKWASYVDHTGDGETGDCIYNCDGDMKSAPYEIQNLGGKTAARLDTSNAKKVNSVITYPEQADDDDHYAAMEESLKTAKFYDGGLPLYERFISKADRDKADEADFAGKGKSFPILKSGDVEAAVHAMGRAGSDNHPPAKLKANIIAIAKRKGWTSELPKSWRGTDATEAARQTEGGALKLVETTAWAEELLLSESVAAGVEREIRIIVPCKGSTAVYTESALKKSAPAFKSGTQMFINHATRAEESARPEGDWRKLAGQLTSDAVYSESHKNGPGLYAKAKFVNSMAPEIIEKASMSGVSIRANGTQAVESGKPLVQHGLPVLDRITNVESIDIVTKAGAGGLILTEAARAENQGDDMTLQEAQALVAKEVKAALAPYAANDLREAAKKEGKAILESVSWPKSAKKRLIQECLKTIPVKEDGSLDAEKWRALVVSESKEFGAVLAEASGSGNVRGMGDSSPFATPITEAQREEQRLAEKRQRKDGERLHEAGKSVFTRLMGGNSEAAAAAVSKGRAA